VKAHARFSIGEAKAKLQHASCGRISAHKSLWFGRVAA
jgi:hypothetical protein